MTDYIRYCDENRYDFVLGSRLVPASQTAEYSRARYFANLFFAFIQQVILKEKIFDLGAYIGFNLNYVRTLRYRSIKPDMSYQPHLILMAAHTHR